MSHLVSAAAKRLKIAMAALTGASLMGFSWDQLYDELTAGYAIRTAAGAVNVLRYIPPSQWAGIAAKTYAYDCTAAINTALLNHDHVYLPPGGYKTTADINITKAANRMVGAGKYATIIQAAHAGNALNVATNNEPWFSHFHLLRETVGARGSRTGVGVRVFGDFAGGSSIQAHGQHVRIEGFARGMDLYGCFLSSFDNITCKRNDISFYLNNNTNDSLVFTRCKSNNSVQQHVVGNGGAAECGGTFDACEFEDGFKFPAFQVAGGTTFFLNFTNCYGYENNAGTDAGSNFNLIDFAIAGRFVVKGGGLSAGGKDDARLVYGRRNASTGRWDLCMEGVSLKSRRTVGPDVDIDANEANGEVNYVAPSCSYFNTMTPACEVSLGSGSLWKARPNAVYQTRTALLQFQASSNRMGGDAAGILMNTGGANENWQNNVLMFTAVNGTRWTSLWPDSAGKWRTKHAGTKAGAVPTTDTDGTVLGTQT